MANTINNKFTALQAMGAGEFVHLNGSLIEHLSSTYQLLKNWGASTVLCDAGLYHAAYGTAGFDAHMLSLHQRDQVAKLIGQEAEAIVYLYCACDRDFTFAKLSASKAIAFKDRFTNSTFSLTDQQAREFCELTVANELELVIASEPFKAEHGGGLKRLFNNMQAWLSNSAISAYQQALHDS
ncbi:hypothetical protein DXX93_15510 [Thalassotalea euphylliae]|uniref:DUF6817 domain-containing protein n=1 Tax=Thalassotalea euphylliae TaxID=1655234 RepID=A0A3E0TV66_9GAMM|nr:hypothetical protein [Thalassotalea euphylliae]REL27825.1 hypothetical protein DXX93_15510 [Thalassotalea euphylliae]